jgi:uncharacterized protein (TIGR00269 family)
MADFIKFFEKKVKKSIDKYGLIKRNEKVAVAISGGKDSTTLLYVLKKLDYNVTGLFINLGIKNNSSENLKRIRFFCEKNEISLKIFDLVKETGYSMTDICSKYQAVIDSTNCAICGVIKRYYLNKIAKEEGFDKIATGHNMDDEAENVLLNIFSNNYELCLGLGPISKEKEGNFFVQRIKPLCDCLNSESKKYADLMSFDIFPEICPLKVNAFRKNVRELLANTEKLSKSIKKNLVKNFYSILIKLKSEENNAQIIRCVNCFEPSRNKICKKCEMFEIIKKQ